MTEPGRGELRRYTGTPAGPVAVRDELLVKLQAVDVGDAPAVTKELMARRQRAREKLATYDRLLADMLDGRDEETFEREAEPIGPYLTLMGG